MRTKLRNSPPVDPNKADVSDIVHEADWILSCGANAETELEEFKCDLEIWLGEIEEIIDRHGDGLVVGDLEWPGRFRDQLLAENSTRIENK